MERLVQQGVIIAIGVSLVVIITSKTLIMQCNAPTRSVIIAIGALRVYWMVIITSKTLKMHCKAQLGVS